MPNIMLTYKCNLNCTYCFADEFVNKKEQDITLENFQKALKFIKTSNNKSVGLIGGEPTIHPLLPEFLEMIIFDKEIEDAVLFTNGLILEPFVRQLTSPKMRLLVNCNSPKDIGEEKFELLKNNLDLLINDYYMKGKITLGINLYSNDLDYKFIIDLLNRYDFDHLRISLTVPNTTNYYKNVIGYFKSRKSYLLKLFSELEKYKILPNYDCNVPPPCIWSADEKKHFEDILEKNEVKKTNLVGAHSHCVPVIDILPDLFAVRCFGFSDFLKVPINEFENLEDLKRYFLFHIDSNAYRICNSADCSRCYYRRTFRCSGGCLAIKKDKLKEVNSGLNELYL